MKDDKATENPAPDNTELKQAHIYVIGDVTGVGYRGYMRMQAKECNVNGYIRNVYHKPDIFGPNGGVEVVVQGEHESVQDFIDHLKEGSHLSRVDDLEIRFEDPNETYKEFAVKKSKSFNPNE